MDFLGISQDRLNDRTIIDRKCLSDQPTTIVKKTTGSYNIKLLIEDTIVYDLTISKSLSTGITRHVRFISDAQFVIGWTDSLTIAYTGPPTIVTIKLY